MNALPERLRRGLGSRRLPCLDGLRAVAAFLVVFFHFGVPYVSGGLGVLIFFVLSGFLITWLMLQEDEATHTVNLRAFYMRRVLRIFPAFYCYAALILAYALVRGRPVVWPQAGASLLYFNNYYQAIFGDPNTGFSHTWSLAIEEQYYLLWPPVFLLIRPDRRRVRTFLMLAIGAVWIHRALLVFVFRVHEGYIYEAFDTRVDHLLIGCLLAVALNSGAWPRLWERVCARPVYAGLTAAVLAVSSAIEAVFGPAYRDSIGCLINPLLAAILIAQLIAMHGTAGGRLVDWPAFRYLGRISYSIYLYQQFLIDAPKKYFPSAPFVVQLMISAAVIVAAASLSYWLVERPFLSLKKRFERRTSESALPAA